MKKLSMSSLNPSPVNSSLPSLELNWYYVNFNTVVPWPFDILALTSTYTYVYVPVDVTMHCYSSFSYKNYREVRSHILSETLPVFWESSGDDESDTTTEEVRLHVK